MRDSSYGSKKMYNLICYSLIIIYYAYLQSKSSLSTTLNVKTKLNVLGKSPALTTQKLTKRVASEENREHRTRLSMVSYVRSYSYDHHLLSILIIIVELGSVVVRLVAVLIINGRQAGAGEALALLGVVAVLGLCLIR